MSSAQNVHGGRWSHCVEVLNFDSVNHLLSTVESNFVNVAKLALEQEEELLSTESSVRGDE